MGVACCWLLAALPVGIAVWSAGHRASSAERARSRRRATPPHPDAPPPAPL